MHYGICTSYIIWDIKYLQSMYAYGITPAIHTHAHIHFQWTTYSSLAALTSIICSKKKKKKETAAICFRKNDRGHQTKTRRTTFKSALARQQCRELA